ncbi:hypothetical protein [Nocardia beijingensis]|uniref:Uncharacterized protein n=1 Tax=Nocardia beijingensis TaxID=95162 RepID=A0ABW7W784_9NOCA
MTDSLFSVDAGSPGTSVELDRQQYTIKRTELGKALVRAGLDPDVQQRIRTSSTTAPARPGNSAAILPRVASSGGQDRQHRRRP